MDLQEFIDRLNHDAGTINEPEILQFISTAAFEAMKLIAELNNSYHELSEIQALFSQIIGKPVDESFALFPPFYTDFGKNITVGKGVFFNSGCCLQDQGGITIGDGTQLGHHVVLAT